MSVNIRARSRHRQLEATGTPSVSNNEQVDNDISVFVEESNSDNILAELNAMRKENQFCDVEILVDDEKFVAHRLVLSACSPYFKAMFLSNCVESKQDAVRIKGVESTMMEMLIDFAYTSTLNITEANCQGLLSAANVLQVIPVRNAACKFLQEHMNDTNCIGIHCFAESHFCLSLQNDSKEYILKNFEAVTKGEEFLNLTAEKLIEFLNSDDLNVHSEEKVFKALFEWYTQNTSQRKEDFFKAFGAIRLPLISPYFLYDHIYNIEVIRTNEHCLQLIMEAVWFQLLPSRQSELHSFRTTYRHMSEKTQVMVAVGGEDAKVIMRSVECYDPIQKFWYPLTSLPIAISKHGFVVTGKNYMYLAGGEYPDGKISHCFYRYDSDLDSWMEMQHMIKPRSELSLVELDGYIYAISGWDGTSRMSSVERFDLISSSWSFVAPLKAAVTNPAAVTHGGNLYVISGELQTGYADNCSIHEYMEMYNPSTNTWTLLNPMLMSCGAAAACVLGNFIYVAGGCHKKIENNNRFERYDIQKRCWKKMSSMCKRRYKPGIAAIAGKIYIIGGEEGWGDIYHDTIECYNPQNDEWTLEGKMTSPKSWMGCGTFLVSSVNKTELNTIDLRRS